MTKQLTKEPSLKELEEILGSKERTLFYLTWLKHDRNATRAYMELHPKVKEKTARTLGSRMLANIDIKVIAAAYGLDHRAYMEQLALGLTATKQEDLSGERVADHRTRKAYHDKLGKIIGAEGPDSQINIQVVVPILGDKKAE